MINIYKDRSKGGNGEMIIETDCLKVEQLISELASAMVTLASSEAFRDDLDFTFAAILNNAFPLAFKIAGYKAETVREQRVLIAGSSLPHATDRIYSHDENGYCWSE
jgi:hypothetical protein